MRKLAFKILPMAKVFSEGLSGNGSLVDQAYTLLRKKIVDLSLPPESALVEQEVATVLDVSKTPVREAIIRLSREGLITVVPKSGSYVTGISIDRYFEACFIRTQLETGCVRRLAASGITKSDEVTLKALLTEQAAARKSNEDARFFELDEAFHRELFSIAGLPGAWEILQTAKAEIDRVRHLKRLFGIRQRRLVVAEHTAIVDAIIARDPDMAEQSLLDNVGAADDAMNTLTENPLLLQTIDDLNKLVAMDGRTRGVRMAAKA